VLILAPQVDAAEVWRAIGRLEGDTAALKEDQREMNRHVDRLFYTILAVGGALLVATFASRFIGGG
jgi:hypothetical protein